MFDDAEGPWTRASRADRPYRRLGLRSMFSRRKAVVMDQAGVRAAMKHNWAATDADVAHEIHHDDVVVDFPQSGERFVGVENFREWRARWRAP